MTDTRVADVLDELYDLWAADTFIAAEVAADRLRIFDGPPEITFEADSMLVVGGSVLAEDTEEPATEVVWDWASMGVDGAHAEIDETILVPCQVSTINGDATAMRDARRTAITIFAAAAAAARNSTLGIPQVMWCTCSVSSIRQLQTESGAECVITFIVRVQTRI